MAPRHNPTETVLTLERVCFLWAGLPFDQMPSVMKPNKGLFAKRRTHSWDGRACRRRPDTWSTTAAGKPLDPTAGCVLPDPCVLSQTHGVGPWDHRTVAGDSVWEWSVLPATQLDLPLPLWSNTHSAGWNRNYPRGVCRGLENRGIHSPCEMSLLQKCPCLH